MIPKNAHRTVHISYDEDKHKFPGGYHHKVFRLTLPCGLRFTFDPTGPRMNGRSTSLPGIRIETSSLFRRGHKRDVRIAPRIPHSRD